MNVFLNHVVTQKGATPYSVYMKAVICEIIEDWEIGLVDGNGKYLNKDGYKQK